VSYHHGQQFAAWCKPSKLHKKSEKLTLYYVQTKNISPGWRPQKHDKQVLRLLESCLNYRRPFKKIRRTHGTTQYPGHRIGASSATLATSSEEYCSATEKLETEK